LLSLELKKRRTREEIKRDKLIAEEEKNLANEARQLQIEIAALQAQKEQDDQIMQSLQEELRYMKGPEPQLLLSPAPMATDQNPIQNK